MSAYKTAGHHWRDLKMKQVFRFSSSQCPPAKAMRNVYEYKHMEFQSYKSLERYNMMEACRCEVISLIPNDRSKEA